jgi:GTPase SAR1 family protein
MPKAISQITRKYKVIILGNKGVDKKTISGRLSGEKFHLNTTTTIKVEFRKILKQFYNQTFEIDLWDTFGQEVFHSLMSMY